VIPLFKSTFSIGRSLLRVEDLIDIAQSGDVKKMILVEDNFYGFRVVNKAFLHAEIPMVYGVKVPVVQSSITEKTSKLIFFPKNNKGVHVVRKLYTKCFTSVGECLNLSDLGEGELDDVSIGVPFYDSYVFNNIFHFGMCDLFLDKYDHFYIEESNNHPFDFQISAALKKLKVKTEKCKSIYYRNKDDFEAFQMYKAVCNRKQGRVPTFSNPRLNDFASNEFCYESYLENVAK
jgi:DNA polymerase III alpha subunit|tara:strand:- start:3051 stop:3749 length:699 start_codon:yes stop_codon:yes gene_type:complete